MRNLFLLLMVLSVMTAASFAQGLNKTSAESHLTVRRVGRQGSIFILMIDRVHRRHPVIGGIGEDARCESS